MKIIRLILIILLNCCFPLLKAQNNIVTFSYNNLGNCVSQNVIEVPNKNKLQSPKGNKHVVYAEVFPSPIFKEYISLHVYGLLSNDKLSYTMVNSSGQVMFSGTIKNGSFTLSTNFLSRGLYIINFWGTNYKQSYKLFKN